MWYTFALMLLFAASSLFAQVSSGGQPPSQQLGLRGQIPTITLPGVEVEELLAEDALAPKEEPARFGWPAEVNLDFKEKALRQSLPDGSTLWRLRFYSPGAYSLNLVYENFLLPSGGELYLYNDDGSMQIGAFTDANNKVDGSFATQPLSGEAITLEYHEAADLAFPAQFRIKRVIHAYRNLFGVNALSEFNDSGSCNINVACTQGDDWTDEIRSVAMILTSGGWRICTGSLVNNTAEDGSQYFLTANHCLGGESSWIFMFNYQSPSCSNINGPTTDTVQGATLRATNSTSDFALLELSEEIPEDYDVYYAGWNREDLAAASACCIHHPSGDIKKISFENQAVISDAYLGNSGQANSHWKVSDWDEGTTEGGSSGSPLYDPEHRVIGQLHGGYAACGNNLADWYGKFSLSWDNGSSASSRLRDWLDPLGTSALTLDGYNPGAALRVELMGMELSGDSDGDGVAEPGESVQLIATLHNDGNETLTGLTGELSCDSQWITVTQASSDWPSIPVDGSASSSTEFELLISADAPAVIDTELWLNLSHNGLLRTVSTAFSVGRDTLYFSDLEGDTSEWTHESAPSWADNWHLSTEDSSSPSNAFKCGSTGTGNYGNSLDARLISPVLQLSESCHLHFQHRIVAEVSGMWADSAYDGGILELSADGVSWQQLFPEEGAYNCGIRSTSNGPFEGATACWSGSLSWQEVSVDLSDWDGQQVQLRFRFGSDDNTAREGWYIDDLLLSGARLSLVPEAIQDLSIVPQPNGTLLLGWSPVNGADRYRIETTEDPLAGWTLLGECAGTEFTVTQESGVHLYRLVCLAEE